MTVQYYKKIKGTGKRGSKEFNRVTNVFRVDGAVGEYRVKGGWLFGENVIWSIEGMGGDGHDFAKITKAEADKLIKELGRE